MGKITQAMGLLKLDSRLRGNDKEHSQFDKLTAGEGDYVKTHPPLPNPKYEYRNTKQIQMTEN
jgi:hypothetical protein